MSAPDPSAGQKKSRLPRLRRRRLRIDLHKAKYILPNLFTISSIFCGFYAITLCLDNPEPIHLYRAALAVFFGMFFDTFDGRVARLTKTQSEFGVQLDSLADAISFGAAPSVLLYRWSLHELGHLGLFLAFTFVTAGALRLARFNVLAAHETGPSKHFVGLPIPLAAGAVVALIMAAYPYERETPDGPMVMTITITRSLEFSLKLVPGFVSVVTVVLALLMVSSVRYRSFKDFRPTKKSLTLVFVLGLVVLAIAVRMRPAVALCALLLGYIVAGLIEQVIFFPRRNRPAGPPTGVDPPKNDPAVP